MDNNYCSKYLFILFRVMYNCKEHRSLVTIVVFLAVK